MVKCMRSRTTQSDKGQGSVPLLPGMMRDKIFFFFFLLLKLSFLISVMETIIPTLCGSSADELSKCM